MTITYGFLLLLLALKLLWNIFTPLAAMFAYRTWKIKRGKKPGSISMMPVIELGIWLLLVAFSFSPHDSFFYFFPRKMFILGASAILASYALASMVGVVTRRFLKGRNLQ